MPDAAREAALAYAVHTARIAACALQEAGYRLKWLHDPPPSGGGSRVFLGSEKASFWYMAESARHLGLASRAALAGALARSAAREGPSARNLGGEHRHAPSASVSPSVSGLSRAERVLGLRATTLEAASTLLAVDSQRLVVSAMWLAYTRVAGSSPSHTRAVSLAHNQLLSTTTFLYAEAAEAATVHAQLAAEVRKSARAAAHLRGAHRHEGAASASRAASDDATWRRLAAEARAPLAVVVALGPAWPLSPPSAADHLAYWQRARGGDPYCMPAEAAAERARPPAGEGWPPRQRVEEAVLVRAGVGFGAQPASGWLADGGTAYQPLLRDPFAPPRVAAAVLGRLRGGGARGGAAGAYRNSFDDNLVLAAGSSATATAAAWQLSSRRAEPPSISLAAAVLSARGYVLQARGAAIGATAPNEGAAGAANTPSQLEESLNLIALHRRYAASGLAVGGALHRAAAAALGAAAAALRLADATATAARAAPSARARHADGVRRAWWCAAEAAFGQREAASLYASERAQFYVSVLALQEALQDTPQSH